MKKEKSSSAAPPEIDVVKSEETSAHLEKELSVWRDRFFRAQRQADRMLARYEAAQDYESSANHWAKASHLSPDAVNNPLVRSKLRDRSRFEAQENGSLLNGIIQTIANDFSGSGLRIRIQDKTISKERRQDIEKRFREWHRKIKLRKLLWQSRFAKIIDGETFSVLISRPRLRHPVNLDWKIVEADCVTDPNFNRKKWTPPEISKDVDGIKLDKFGYPEKYYIYNFYPQEIAYAFKSGTVTEGQWISADEVTHWFKPFRPWHRGIPEVTPSLPLCAVARRYTFALVKCMELQASLAAVLESEGPAYSQAWKGEGGPFFDVMPIEAGMFNILPNGFHVKDISRVPVGQQYDTFMGSLIREICRPLLVPYNMQIGSSKDSNMASGVLDAGIYTNAQESERRSWEEECGVKMVESWYEMGCLIPGYFTQGTVPIHERTMPEFTFQWDQVTIQHTDPTKIANSLKIAKESFLMSDRDIQEKHYNKDIDEFREDLLEDADFAKTLAEKRLTTAELLKKAESLTSPDEEEEEEEDDFDHEN